MPQAERRKGEWGIWIKGPDFPQGKYFRGNTFESFPGILRFPQGSPKIATFLSKGHAEEFLDRRLRIFLLPNQCEVVKIPSNLTEECFLIVFRQHIKN